MYPFARINNIDKEIENRVISVIASTYSGISEQEIILQTELLKIGDSLDKIDLGMELEYVFDIEFTDEQISEWKTVEDVIKGVQLIF